MTMTSPRKKHRPFSFMDPRDLGYMKPHNYRGHMTLTEVAREVGCDSSWIRKLERAGRIPKATRVQRGELMIRLWSPEQVAEIKQIKATHRVGRPTQS